MSDEIIKVLDDLSGRFGIALDWTNENVIQQLIVIYHKYVIYSIVKHTICLLLSVAVMIIFLKGFVFLYQQYIKCFEEKKDNVYFSIKDVSYYSQPKHLVVETNDNTYACIAISTIICFAMLVVSLYNLHYLLQVILSPEIYTLNSLMNIYKNTVVFVGK